VSIVLYGSEAVSIVLYGSEGVCSVWIGGFPAGEGEKENRGGKKINLKLSVHEYGADGFKV